ncbi:MAG: hypothetical protein JF616_11940 [Fibrobacteres bacterium]|nr:hypothetical protein [Fibrobacterota bacterium]
MRKPLAILAPLLIALALAAPARAEKITTMESPHYRVAYEKKYQQLAGEVLGVAESVWPTLAKAYESYDRYEKITIRIVDEGDEANGFAIYNFSSIEIFPSHMDWVMRNRQLWIQNVVTHELAHVFSLRRAAWLSPVDAVDLYGSTYNYNANVNYSFHYPWVPLIAPTWYVEGIAQFEAYMNGNDSWDSQRDMVLRDAYLTGTLPSLDFIETFDDDEDWTQAERTYNTGYGFLIYLKDRFGADKVRKLAFAKPLFNFSWSVEKAFGKGLPDLFEDFKRSLSDRYADFKDIPRDSVADPDMRGGYQQNLAFSPDGKYMAWLGNDEERRAPLNWIYWKPVGGKTTKSGKPSAGSSGAPASSGPSPAPDPVPAPSPAPARDGFLPGEGPVAGPAGVMPPMRAPNPAMALMKRATAGSGGLRSLRGTAPRALPAARVHAFSDGPQRSEEYGSAGLEFNREGTRLLTARQDRHAEHTDLWEYEFRSDKSESEKWHRLTWEERAAYPSYHPSKGLIVYSRKDNGSSNLAILDSSGRTHQLTNFSNGEQVYNPRFTPKGDSIYFTLGLENKEAIVAINADAPAFNPFLALKDSSLFPDSLPVARGQKLAFVVDWRKGALRNLRFSGDTLFFSSNAEDSVYSVYDVYARLPGDSTLYRATHVASQALEPLPHDGTLYYQGFQQQQFRIFREPLNLVRTARNMGPARDTLPAVKPNKLQYDSIFETGDYHGTKVAADITPFVALSPVFLSGNTSYTDVVAGLNLAFGEAYGGLYQSLSGAFTKRTRLDAPLDYLFTYDGMIAGTTIRHTRFEWTPALYYSVYHDIIGNNDVANDVLRGNIGADEAEQITQTNFSTEWSRWAVSAVAPLPYDFTLGGSYWQQFITQDFTQQSTIRLLKNDSIVNAATQPRTDFLRDASEHKHYEANMGWSWSKSMLATFLPTGGGLYGLVHKYWATYQTNVLSVDTASLIRISGSNAAAPLVVPVQSEYDPWSVEGGVGGMYSFGRRLSLFANAEAGEFLNTFPTVSAPGHVSGNDTVFVRQPQPYLWPITYRLGYYRMSGYPYNFYYRGRDIMEGTFYAFGQAGASIPLKAGAFIPDLPTTSLKQFMLTGLCEWGTTLLSTPDAVGDSLWIHQYHLLLDVGVRLSANFRLYHQYPFTAYVQVFQPINNLKADNLYGSDYGNDPKGMVDANGNLVAARDAQARRDYINVVKKPRFYVGFNLGLF